MLCLTATVSGYFLAFLAEESYEASALVLVRPQDNLQLLAKSSNKELLSFPVGQTMSVETPGKTYIEIITSNLIVESVVRILKLDQRKKKKKKGFLSKLLGEYKEPLKNFIRDSIQILKYGRTFERNKFLKTVKGVKKNLSLETTADTYVFRITYSADDPELAAQIANTTARIFTNYLSKIHQSESGETRKYLEDTLEESKNLLLGARKDLQSFKERHATFSYTDEYAEKLKVITELEIDLEKSETELAGLEERYPPSNPVIKSQMAERSRLLTSIDRRKRDLKNLPRLERQLAILDLNIDVARNAYELIAKEVKEASIKESKPLTELRIVSLASAPNYPNKPLKFYYAGVSLFAALLAGVGLVFFLEYINSSIRSQEDVRRVLDLPVLATIPLLARKS